MAIFRPILLVVFVAGLAVLATQWRSAEAGAAPVERPRVTAAPTESAATPVEAHDQARSARALPRAARGFVLPDGFALPEDPELLPGSPREYRGGFHEGIDFPLAFGMTVVAAKAGTIVRIDTAYTEWSVEEQLAAEDEAFHLGYTPEATLDKLRGRQVWIDHGQGVLTRYAHLDGVEPLAVGTAVAQGTVIGRAGNSGTKAGPHLHVEIRVGGAYLGEGLGGAALLKALRSAFS